MRIPVLVSLALSFASLVSVGVAAPPRQRPEHLAVDAPEAARIRDEIEQASKKSVSTFDEFERRWRGSIQAKLREDWQRLTANGTIAACEGTEALVLRWTEPGWSQGGDVDAGFTSFNEIRKAHERCEDPIFRFLCGRAGMFGEAKRPAFRGVMAPAFEYAAAPTGALLSPEIRMHILLETIRALGSTRKEPRAERIAAPLEEAMLAFAVASAGRAEGDRTPGSEAWWKGRLAYAKLADALEAFGDHAGGEAAVALSDRLAATPSLDPWLAHALKALGRSIMAEAARGTDWAAKTPPERFEQGAAWSVKAIAEADLALAEDRSRPEPHVIAMTGRSFGMGDAFEKHLRGAMEACVTWPTTQTSAVMYAMPRWSGGERLAEIVVALATADVGSAALLEPALDGVAALIDEGATLDELLAEPILGPAIERAATRHLAATVERGDAPKIARAAAWVAAIAISKGRWDDVMALQAAHRPLSESTLEYFGPSPAMLERELRVRAPEGAAAELRVQAAALQDKGSLAEAAERWSAAAQSPDQASDRLGILKRALEARADACRLRESLRAGRETSLSRVGFTDSSIERGGTVIGLGTGSGAGSEGRIQMLSSPPGSWTFATLDEPLDSPFVLAGTLDWSLATKRTPDPDGTFLGVGLLAARYPSRSGVHAICYFPVKRILRISHWGLEEESTLDIETPDIEGSSTPFSVELRGRDAVVSLGGKERWRGTLPAVSPMAPEGNHLSLISQSSSFAPLQFTELTLRPAEASKPGSGS